MHRLTPFRVRAFRGRECLHALSADTMVGAFALLRSIVADALDPIALDDGTTRVDVTQGDLLIRRVRIASGRARDATVCTCLAPPGDGHALHCARVLGASEAA